MDPDHIRELFSEFGRVDVRRMFSGAGVFADDVMIALVSRGVIYFKADEHTIPSFEQEGLAPFSYTAKGSMRMIGSYWRMPDRLYDDPAELAQWARAALAAARRKAEARISRAARKPARRKVGTRKVKRPASA